jgi:uncharacterized membrane protein YgcG
MDAIAMNNTTMQIWRNTVSAAVLGALAGCCCPKPCLVVPGCLHGHRTMAVPDVMPLGAITRAHWHMQETNGEAADFIMHRNEFVDNSSELSPYGRDHIAEIAARMPSAPFPVIVQRSLNNSDPELDQIRRDLVVRVLTDMGNVDADQRVVVSQPYSDGINSMEGEFDYGRFRGSRNQNGGGFGGGFGGGGGGFGGF